MGTAFRLEEAVEEIYVCGHRTHQKGTQGPGKQARQITSTR